MACTDTECLADTDAYYSTFRGSIQEDFGLCLNCAVRAKAHLETYELMNAESMLPDITEPLSVYIVDETSLGHLLRMNDIYVEPTP
jgi:hypothetical protein